MAEVNSGTATDKRRRGGQRSKKLSTRVDLTPMVDLGFLLITFFIFTTTMNESRSMHVVLPADAKNNDWTRTAVSGVITLIPTAGDSLYYYEGADPSKGFFISEGAARSVIMRKKRTTDANKFMVILRPSPACSYKNVINLLDEMQICAVGRYVMTDAGQLELLALKGR